MKKYFNILTILMALTACDFYDQTVIIDLPEHDPKLVLNSIISTEDTVARFIVTKSVIASSSESVGKRIENLSISLLRNGAPVEDLTEDPESGHYLSYHQPQIGDQYEISVSAPGFETISSQVEVPDTCQILGLRWGGKRYDIDGYEYQALMIKIRDLPNQENYYALELQSDRICTHTYYDNGTDTTYQSSEGGYTIYFQTPLTWLTSYNYGDGFVFTDKAFENGEIELEVWLENYYIDDGWDFENTDEFGNVIYREKCTSKMLAVVQTISETWYDYASKTDIHSDNQYPGLFSGEPVPMPSNIENGFGIFGAISVASRAVEVEN